MCTSSSPVRPPPVTIGICVRLVLRLASRAEAAYLEKKCRVNKVMRAELIHTYASYTALHGALGLQL